MMFDNMLVFSVFWLKEYKFLKRCDIFDKNRDALRLDI